jgi:hypothetical protein
MSTFGGIRVRIASPPDREQLVAELLIAQGQLADVRYEDEELVVDIYSQIGGRPWVVRATDLRNALAAGMEMLRSRYDRGGDEF